MVSVRRGENAPVTSNSSVKGTRPRNVGGMNRHLGWKRYKVSGVPNDGERRLSTHSKKREKGEEGDDSTKREVQVGKFISDAARKRGNPESFGSEKKRGVKAEVGVGVKRGRLEVKEKEKRKVQGENPEKRLSRGDRG